MPVPNDLTAEDEAEFARHGVSSAGAGSEPVIENDQDRQQQSADDQGQQGQSQHGDRQQGQGEVVEISNRRQDGTFKSKEEMDAERAAAGQQGQQGQDDGGEPKMVPLAALHAERARFAEISRRASMAEARMNAMLTRGFGGQPGQREEVAKPNLQENPAEYILDLERRLDEFTQGRQQDEETRQVDTALTNDEELFKAVAPDYDQASDHYVQSRARELLQFYTPQDAQRIMMDEARNIAKQAWARGQSAGEMVYRLAMARGYVPNQGQQGQQGQGQGQQDQGQGQRGGPSAQDTVRSIRQSQENSRSLAGGRGGGAQALNAAALLEMSDEEFEEHLGIGKKGANQRFAAIG